jgi:hypothetical protein
MRRRVEVFIPLAVIDGVERMAEKYSGFLLAWSTDFEELRDGVGQCPVGIVEMSDGNVRIVPAERIRFTDR